MFQGNLKRKNYFEGWYYKLVDKTEKNIYAFIPVISLDKKYNSSHAFIQMLNGSTGETFHFKYPISEFKSSSKSFKVKIGANYFSLNQIELNINQNGQKIKGKLRFSDLVPWKKTLLSPGIMGPFTFVPFMECYHGMLSMNHKIFGQLIINQTDISYNGGLGYIEKDWGISFPNGYIWMQSNHFNKENISFMASIANIPFLGRYFIGYLVILWYGGEIYLFTTYTGAKIYGLNINKKRVKLAVANKNHLLLIDAKKIHMKDMKVSQELAGTLKSPIQGAMKSRIMESLTSQISLQLYSRDKHGKKKSLLFKDSGKNDGLEIEAKTEDLI